MSCHLLSIKFRAIFLIFSSILFSNLSQTSGQVQVRECPMNDWCQSPQASSFPLAYYKFIVVDSNMTWFEALEECRNEGNSSELLVIESASERAWVKQMIARQTNKNDQNDQMWYVNAHKYLYNSVDPAWADGRSLSKLEIRTTTRTAQPKNCSAMGNIHYEVENECYGFVINENTDLSFADVNCTSEYTSRAICKRSNLSKEKRNFENSVSKFNRNEWVQSTRNERLFYRFINLERDKKLNWYSARLLCVKYGAVLSDIEDEANFEDLKKLIGQREMSSVGSLLYVNLHRYLYNTREWTWGGPPNADRSFDLNKQLLFQNDPPADHCEPKLCAFLLYSNQLIVLVPMYCGGKTWPALAICKKLLPLSTTSTSSQTSENSFLKWIKSFLSSEQNLVFLAFIAIIIGVSVAVFLACCCCRNSPRTGMFKQCILLHVHT